ncbi:hypothetical protein HMPREF9061_00038 [Actinomyces sp. oral taxon 181 str. F0379]|nr:hypothetical protein HMPREF9061_00038 [Actinomyces sp. oral taxon 181 str. F0379]
MPFDWPRNSLGTTRLYKQTLKCVINHIGLFLLQRKSQNFAEKKENL